jgi:hypothetical protein
VGVRCRSKFGRADDEPRRLALTLAV